MPTWDPKVPVQNQVSGIPWSVQNSEFSQGRFWFGPKMQQIGLFLFLGSDPGSVLTSEVLDEILKLHLPLRLDVGAVHVRVEENYSEGQDKDGVGVAELTNHTGVADTVPLAASV